MKTKLGKLKGRIFSKNHDRGAPPGQFVTEKFPVLTFGETPKIDIAQWNLKLFGLTQNDITLKWDDIMGLKRVSIEAEFHCVTQWSRLVNTWDGVSFKSIIDFVDVVDATNSLINACKHLDGFTIQNNLHNEHYERTIHANDIAIYKNLIIKNNIGQALYCTGGGGFNL